MPALPSNCGADPQIGQRKQRSDLRRIFVQTPVVSFHVPDLALDLPKGMLHFCANARLKLLGRAQQFSPLADVLDDFTFARAQGYGPNYIGVRTKTLFNTVVRSKLSRKISSPENRSSELPRVKISKLAAKLS